MKKLLLSSFMALPALCFLFVSFVSSPYNSSDNTIADNQPSIKNVATYNQGLTLEIANKTVPKGNEVCVEISAKDFYKIVSMQYSMKWDAQILQFKRVEKFKLPAMTAQNFGTQAVEKGILTFAWYDPDIQGISLNDGELLYQVCFQVVGNSGARTFVNFTDHPTVKEISNGAGDLIPLNSVRGVVRVK